MNFMKWITSLDEVLFELISWLVFWPVTLVRSLVTPVAMMRYADAQLAKPEEEQYGEALSPPVFLILTLVVAHLVGQALGQADVILANRRGLAGMVDNDTSAIVVRLLLFAVFPLLFSVILLAAKRRVLTRATLQPLFYAQCYPAAVFAALLDVCTQLSLTHLAPDGVTVLLTLGAAGWLLAVETVWFARENGFRWAGAAALALVGLMAGTALVLGIGMLLTQ